MSTPPPPDDAVAALAAIRSEATRLAEVVGAREAEEYLLAEIGRAQDQRRPAVFVAVLEEELEEVRLCGTGEDGDA